jgi:hypothetical protein
MNQLHIKRERIKRNLKLFEFVVYGLLIIFFIFISKSNISALTDEDGIVEYLSASLWLVGFLICINYLRKKRGSLRKKRGSHRIIMIIFLFVCAISLMEEISWGQRILNLKTPECIAEKNTQKELTIHNLKILCSGSTWRDFFRTGKISIHQITDAQNLFRLGFVTYFLFFPLLYHNRKGRYILSKIDYYKPTNSFLIILWLVIISSFLLTIKAPNYFVDQVQEIREMCYALFIALYLNQVAFALKDNLYQE